jgi:hypothetical protein
LRILSFGLCIEEDGERQADSPSGLFLATAFINHACDNNAIWQPMGDCMVVRALRPLKAGTEVLHPYIPVEASSETRRSIFEKHFDSGSCNCTLCTADKKDGMMNLRRRNDLLEQFKTVMASLQARGAVSGPQALAAERRKLSSLLVGLEKTYTTSRTVRPDLVEIYHALAELTGIETDSTRAESNKLDLKALAASGAVVNTENGEVKVTSAPVGMGFMAVPLLLNVAHRHSLGGQTREAKKWLKAALEMSRIRFGDDKQRFVTRHAKLLSEMGFSWCSATVRFSFPSFFSPFLPFAKLTLFLSQCNSSASSQHSLQLPPSLFSSYSPLAQLSSSFVSNSPVEKRQVETLPLFS